MISTSGVGQATDPTLATLVPRRSPLRNVTLLLAAVVLLAGVGWTGVDGRPGLDNPGASSGVVAAGQVLSVSWVTPRGLPALRITSITPVPGTRVAGAWILEPDDPLYPGMSATWDDKALARSLAAGDRADASLPRPVRSGHEVALVVLYDVLDCSVLPRSADEARDVSNPVGVVTHLRTWFSTETDVPTPSLWLWDAASLTDAGGCPAG